MRKEPGNHIRRGLLLCLCTPLLFLGCGEASKDTQRPGAGSVPAENAAGAAERPGTNPSGHSRAGEPADPGNGVVPPPNEGRAPVDQPPSGETPPPAGGNTGGQPAAQAESHFTLSLEAGSFDEANAQVHINLAVEPADTDLTRKGVRTALVELHHSSGLVLQDPNDGAIVVGAAAPGVSVRSVVKPPNEEGTRVLRAMLVNWNDTLMKPGRLLTLNFRRAGAGPYSLSWKTGPKATAVTPRSANKTLEVEDAVFNFQEDE
jgi:hypothetical protein